MYHNKINEGNELFIMAAKMLNTDIENIPENIYLKLEKISSLRRKIRDHDTWSSQIVACIIAEFI